MKLGKNIYFNKDLKNLTFADKMPMHFKGQKVGHITKSYIKDGQLWITMKIDKNKIKEIK